jgi:hypothetical protein
MFDTKNVPTIRDLMSNIDLEFLAWLSGGLSILDVAHTPEFQMVELTGIEPVASWLQTRRSPS